MSQKNGLDSWDQSVWLRDLELACRSEVAVLITGPTGSGKTTLARRIHERGCRKNSPFVTVNLASLHEGTLESELFGHEKGAFTGADQRRVGRLESANGGTVFLDEIGELSPRLQARLLEFLQSHVVVPVGSNRELHLDVRVVAATQKNLSEAVRQGEFRADLFHRLRVVHLKMKSLTECSDEFGEIVHDIIGTLSKKYDRKVLRISEEVAHCLESYSWPGNYRELEGALEAAVLACSSGILSLKDLPEWVKPSKTQDLRVDLMGLLGTLQLELTRDFRESQELFEKEYFRRALKLCEGRLGKTASFLGMSKTTLLRKLRALSLTDGFSRTMENQPFSA